MKVLHAGTRQQEICSLPGGGRVLGVTTFGPPGGRALQAHLRGSVENSLQGMHHRTDIGGGMGRARSARIGTMASVLHLFRAPGDAMEEVETRSGQSLLAGCAHAEGSVRQCCCWTKKRWTRWTCAGRARENIPKRHRCEWHWANTCASVVLCSDAV